MNNDKKLVLTLQIGTILAVVLIVVLMLVLVVQYVEKSVYAERLSYLTELNEKLEEERASISEEREYQNSQAYIEQLARELGMLKLGENRFEPQ